MIERDTHLAASNAEERARETIAYVLGVLRDDTDGASVVRTATQIFTSVVVAEHGRQRRNRDDYRGEQRARPER